MLAHELAQLLLDGPNVLVVIKPAPSSDWISGIDWIADVEYLPFDDDSAKTTAVVLAATEESLNKDEDLEFLDSDDEE